MKIRRKAPKPSRSGPAFVIGYTGAAPAPSELQYWFDLEYGGPLRLHGGGRSVRAEHGPWSAVLEWLAGPEAERWREGLGWDHRSAAQIVPTTAHGPSRLDQVLHLARLARGLGLLTQGTAYDLLGARYLNPSDWTDLRLERFHTADHISVQQPDSARPGYEWFVTRGLTKFGLDELETYRPLGLPAASTHERLASIAEAVLETARPMTVGSRLTLPDPALAVEVVGHRTVSLDGFTVPVREVSWTAGDPTG